MLKNKSKRNKTITLTENEEVELWKKITISKDEGNFEDVLLFGDMFDWVKLLPDNSVSLLFLDPPYNMSKKFNDMKFSKRSVEDYCKYLESIIEAIKLKLKSNATIYICGDWFSSVSIYDVVSKHFIVRNRITWEREKGRGSKTNWKNSSEDVWFCTLSKDYVFNVNDIKKRKKVIAPYTDNGKPKDWDNSEIGKFRDTYPSNLWTDITIPFWSMSENTEHPTQKSEKFVARLILASSNEGDLILDPFGGSGTTAVVAKKLRRKYISIEMDKSYILTSAKRLQMAESKTSIQGYSDGVFWERNTGGIQNISKNKNVVKIVSDSEKGTSDAIKRDDEVGRNDVGDRGVCKGQQGEECQADQGTLENQVAE